MCVGAARFLSSGDWGLDSFGRTGMDMGCAMLKGIGRAAKVSSPTNLSSKHGEVGVGSCRDWRGKRACELSWYNIGREAYRLVRYQIAKYRQNLERDNGDLVER